MDPTQLRKCCASFSRIHALRSQARGHRDAASERLRSLCVCILEGVSHAKTQGHGIVLDEKGQEQPADKDRAQKADKTQPGHMPPQPDEDELQPLKEKSGF
jgi:chorismate synthase